MTVDNRDHKELLRDSFRKNVERLLKLLDLNAPNVIIANDIALLFHRAFAIYPELAAAYGDFLLKDSRRASGLCIECGEKHLANFEGMCCEKCDLEMMQDETGANP